MARLVYACRFDVPSKDGFAAVLAEYSNWIEQHYRSRRGISDFKYNLANTDAVLGLPEGHTIQRDYFVSKNGEVVRLGWAYPVDNDPTLEWRNEIRIGGLQDDCAVEHLISISSVEYSIIPARLSLGSPGVIRRLCSTASVEVGDMTVKAQAYDLGADSVHHFVELLQSPKRRLPIVFISPYSDGQVSELDADKMAMHLAAVAVIVKIRDSEATWDVADAIGRTMSCFDGAARIYWPGFSPDDDPRSHRLYFGSTIREIGASTVERSIERSIFAVAAFRFASDTRLNDIVREAEQAERQQRLGHQKTTNGIEWEDIAAYLDRDLSEAKQRIGDLEAENRNLKANQQILFSAHALGDDEEEDTGGAPVPAAPKTVEEACQTAKDFPHLIILDSALEAAHKSPFKRPTDILEALTSLEEIAAHDLEGDILRQLRDRGLGKRSSMHISGTTKAKYGKNYQFDYDGKRQYFEPHITLGSGDANLCASIHYILDHRLGKIVVGYVGRHLPNTKT
jgi:hypothetical protein